MLKDLRQYFLIWLPKEFVKIRTTLELVCTTVYNLIDVSLDVLLEPFRASHLTLYSL